MLFPFLVSLPPGNTLSHPPSSCFYESTPPPTHPFPPHLSCISYAGASSLHRTKGLPFHWCQIRPSSATYVSGAMDPSMAPYSLIRWFSLWKFWVVQWVDIAVLPMGFQTPSATSVLFKTPLLGSLCLVQWLAMSIVVIFSSSVLSGFI